MPPLGISSSYSTDTLKTGAAKLWILLVGVNNYQDPELPSLRYPAVDCQGLGEAISQATQGFPNKEVIIHHDFAPQPPTLAVIRGSLQQIVSQTQFQDFILLYFSGHGILEPNSQQAVLCLTDTRTDNLLATGLGLQELLQILGRTSANQQLICLDTCHSGDMKLFGLNSGKARDGSSSEAIINSAPKLTEVLRQRAAQSKGFCALLSCDQGQKSWEFPELGHGLFTYYLMRGLLGEAADSSGVIEADGLYKYVYRQTLQYIDKLNQQLRLINQQKLNRGESKLHPEYPLQTPKRIVEGVGELILGLKSANTESHQQRRALVLDGLANKKITTDLSRLLAGAGGFEVEIYPQKGKSWSDPRGKIQAFLRWHLESATPSLAQSDIVKNIPTSLLYLRGQIEEIEDGEAWLVLGDGSRLSRSCLRQELRRAFKTQQIIILDCPDATSLEHWIEDLQIDTEHGQCIIAGSASAEEAEVFSQKLLDSLLAANSQTGLSVAKWITELQTLLLNKNINLYTWLSGTHTVIDILPGHINTGFQNSPDLESTDVEENQQEDQTQLLSLSYSSESEDSAALLFVTATESVDKIQPQRNIAVDSEQYKKLEKLLKQSIGLIAPNILQTTWAKTSTYQELVQNLAIYFLPEQQQEFQQQAMAILEDTTILSDDKLHTSANLKLEQNFISKCERELAYLVGPIASYITQQILKSQPQISLEEFVNKLAAQIPEPQLAVEFEQRLLCKKNI